ncbi:hypothetical protein Gbth_044_056 [Gluconobacter thailandicus F149-1 = NBRC 100600]|uniref:CAAX amino terminal protease family protein n=2 Tax=Gluconobacter thailandicus TaxID=257438 RepID=A0ABQ0IYC4_GLUTH|nr:CPBP family intramembrane glutamic endopeptidase [Gluconobacter thailandicus]KXV53606.1 CAAX protease [Gluconobacter thailandicus]GAC88503.1 CAAX amino terminal protease family protein [Gluconobacter thailandicus NBRC 3255]GAD27208.1 CAAX amino terminal protease family protein [Gluconobacter thailandicus NBRC 3257]GAN94099.1 hypothetical protein Gbth_044_056 [Gluconobacter thailandicus F149-1 = NBRC 100600]GBR58243.1 hypothetical protein AA100600_0688 [Gluconobacter thailandicus F149-1 = NB
MPVRPTVPLGRRLYLGAEFLTLHGGGPLLILFVRRAGLLFGLLWIAALLAFLSLRHQKSEVQDFSGEVRRISLRFAVLAPLIILLTWWVWPDVFLSLPKQRPLFWLLVMVLYPILSVWPQEVLYRAFLFSRYDSLFRLAPVTIGASAVAFGFAHILFLNWIAVGMTLVGGALFASDYSRHRSLTLTCFEHSLYGCLIFTVGLGRFFYTGAAWHS